MDPRWPHGISRRQKRLTTPPGAIVADNEIALTEEDFFPMVVNEAFRCKRKRVDFQQPRTRSALGALIDVARENLLGKSQRIAGDRFPAGAEIQGEEFSVLFFSHYSPSLRSISSTVQSAEQARHCRPGVRRAGLQMPILRIRGTQ